MTLDEILNQWETDSKIDRLHLDRSSLSIQELHQKYWRVLSKERLTLVKLLTEHSKLKLDKHEFYRDGPSKETVAKGWIYPLTKVMVKDIPMYMEADTQIIEANIRLAIVKEKINLLEDIIKTVHNRGHLIRNALEDIRLKAGG